MKKLSNLALIFISTLLSHSTAYAASAPNTDNPTTFLGPTARLGFTQPLNNWTAYHLAGEAGINNFRASGTLGWQIATNKRFKVTGEYLWQSIAYSFFSGDTEQWVQQGTIAAEYQYDIADNNWRPTFALSAYAATVPSKGLHTVTDTFVNNENVSMPFTDVRRIAGSSDLGIAPEMEFAPWKEGRITAMVNYDHIRYAQKNNPYYNEDAIGVGGTLKLNQALTDHVDLALAAAVRAPFNNYAANFSWHDASYIGRWRLGLFGDYTTGKHTLPNTYNGGFSADYSIDKPSQVASTLSQPNNVMAWTTAPAVYMPQVLAIADESFKPGAETYKHCLIC